MTDESSDTALATTDFSSGREVYDAAKDKMVRVASDQIRRASWMHRQVEMATLVKALALSHIADEELYLGLGCSSFKEYSETMLHIGYRNVQRYLAIGRKFRPLMPELREKERAPLSLKEAKKLQDGNESSDDTGVVYDAENGDSEPDSRFTHVTELGVRKLYQLSQMDDVMFEDVVTEGKLVMPDGETEYTLAELRAMKTRQYAEVVEQAQMDKRAYQARIHQLEEELKKKESEHELDKRQIEKANDKLKKAIDIERRYGRTKEDYEFREKRLQEAGHLLREVRALVVPLGLDETAAQGHKNKVQEIVRECYSLYVDIRDANVRALEEAQDNIALEGLHQDVDEVYEEVFGGNDDEPHDADEEPAGDDEESADTPSQNGRVIPLNQDN